MKINVLKIKNWRVFEQNYDFILDYWLWLAQIVSEIENRASCVSE